MKNKKTFKILDIVDIQNGFIAKDGNLSIEGAAELVSKIQTFVDNLPKDYYDLILVKYDTHIKGEYKLSEESKMFPLHCEYGTKDWELVIDPKDLESRENCLFLVKNIFDMWGKGTNVKKRDIDFQDEKEENLYNNLFNVFEDAKCEKPLAHRDELMNIIFDGSHNVEVDLLGVASDFCNRDAFEGYLARGATVNIIEDLTKGIVKETSEVIAEEKYNEYTDEKLLNITTTDILYKKYNEKQNG